MMNINVIEEKERCSGCEACIQICPKSCVSMKEDDEGFSYPLIDEESCINCALCEKVCPVIHKNSCVESTSYPKVIGGWHKNEEVLTNSSSGGAFTLFADYILEQDGYVFGCTLDSNLRAIHLGINEKKDLYLLQKSKYVQSEIGNVFNEIYDILKNNKKVLFVGAPCQAAGLHHFIEKKTNGCKEIRSRLFICDFICHGVPSPKVFRDYISSVEKKYNDKIISFSFRCKDKGWHASGLQLGTETVFSKGSKLRKFPAYKDSYMNGFLDDIYLRTSCYNCEFKDTNKYYTDFTIGDFWGVHKLYPTLYNRKGTSMVVLYNKHAEWLFDCVKDNFCYEECDFEKVVTRNQPLIKSAEYPARREAFFYDYKISEFDKVEKKYMNAFKWAGHKIMRILWRSIEAIIKFILGKFLQLLHIKWDETQWLSFFQFIKFCFVGLSNTIISYAINMLVLIILQPQNWRFDYIIANITGFSLSVLWSYRWNNRHVFPKKRGQVRSKAETLMKTYASYAFTGIILNNILGTIWIRKMGISKFISPLLNLFFTVPTNFFMNKLWTYGENKRRDITEEDD